MNPLQTLVERRFLWIMMDQKLGNTRVLGYEIEVAQ